MSKTQIERLVHHGLERRPHLIKIIRLRNAAILFTMVIAFAFMKQHSHLEIGVILILVGGTSTAFILIWNLVWVNTILYRISRQEAKNTKPELSGSDPRSRGFSWVRLVDLPGYREWAADYDRLERIIPDLENYFNLFNLEQVKQQPSVFFEKFFQGAIDDVYEHFGLHNLPRSRLEDYKRGGRFFNENA